MLSDHNYRLFMTKEEARAKFLAAKKNATNEPICLGRRPRLRQKCATDFANLTQEYVDDKFINKGDFNIFFIANNHLRLQYTSGTFYFDFCPYIEL